jgi:hypothetical protein
MNGYWVGPYSGSNVGRLVLEVDDMGNHFEGCAYVYDRRHRDRAASRSSGEWNDDYWRKMTRTELIIQLLKVAIGLAFGAYFVWWSLQVLDRLTPEYDAPTAVVARAS